MFGRYSTTCTPILKTAKPAAKPATSSLPSPSIPRTCLRPPQSVRPPPHLVAHEAHELAHGLVGRILTRDAERALRALRLRGRQLALRLDARLRLPHLLIVRQLRQLLIGEHLPGRNNKGRRGKGGWGRRWVLLAASGWEGGGGDKLGGKLVACLLLAAHPCYLATHRLYHSAR